MVMSQPISKRSLDFKHVCDSRHSANLHVLCDANIVTSVCIFAVFKFCIKIRVFWLRAAGRAARYSVSVSHGGHGGPHPGFSWSLLSNSVLYFRQKCAAMMILLCIRGPSLNHDDSEPGIIPHGDHDSMIIESGPGSSSSHGVRAKLIMIQMLAPVYQLSAHDQLAPAYQQSCRRTNIGSLRDRDALYISEDSCCNRDSCPLPPHWHWQVGHTETCQ